MPLYRGTSQTGQNSLVSNTETTSAPTETVRLVKASREAAERGWNHISILKLDTEGCEVPILSELLGSVPDIELIYCEYHAEDDRRTIDALVADRFCLYWGTATKLHQGTCLYMSRSLIANMVTGVTDGYRMREQAEGCRPKAEGMRAARIMQSLTRPPAL